MVTQNNNHKHIIIVAGEASGDLYAAHLIDEIKKQSPNITFSGLGGKEMKSRDVNVYYDLTQFAVIGILEVLKYYSIFKNIFDLIVLKIKEEKPVAVILIDYPGFNLRLAKVLKKLDIKVIFYISPQVWAWKKNRVFYIQKYVDKMLVLFQFEKEFYDQFGIDVTCVGHPLIDCVKETLSPERQIKKLNLKEDCITIALLPGSREKEIERHLPPMIKAMHTLNTKFSSIQFIILKAISVDHKLVNSYIKDIPNNCKVVEGDNYNTIKSCNICLVASGTATLEVALLEVPMVIIYKTSWLTYVLAKAFIKIPDIGLVNIIAQKKLVPECIQHKATGTIIAKETENILKNDKKSKEIVEGLKDIRSSLGGKGAIQRTATEVINFIQ